MTDADWTALLLLGLVSCYFAGYKFGVIHRVIKNLGRAA